MESVREFEKDELTEKVIGCAYTVLNALGPGFLEKVYENALAHEMTKHGLSVSRQGSLSVTYDGVVVGDYCYDLLVNATLLVELKACKSIDDSHIAQCINYLRATGLKICLLLNFGGAKLGIKRISL